MEIVMVNKPKIYILKAFLVMVSSFEYD